MRYYTSVSAFSAEFSAVFSAAIGLPEAADTAEFQTHITNNTLARDSTIEYKEKKKLAKRIIKAVQSSLEDATRKESELCRKPFEKELRELDIVFENSFISRRDSLANSLGGEISELDAEDQRPSVGEGSAPHLNNDHDGSSRNGIVDGHTLETSNSTNHTLSESASSYPDSTFQQDLTIAGLDIQTEVDDVSASTKYTAGAHQPTPEDSNATPPTNGNVNHGHHAAEIGSTISLEQNDKPVHRVEPPTPPSSSEGDVHSLSNGGIPWYMGPFDPVGTTIEEERWTGRELVRGMSEELSDMDEEELSGLVDVEMTDVPNLVADGSLHPESAAASTGENKPKRRRWRGYR